MTGQEFIDKLTQRLTEQGKLQTEYNAADLTEDAAAAGLWYRKPSSYSEQENAQQQDIEAAKEEARQ